VYSVVLGQCTDTIRAKLEGQTKFTAIFENSDRIALLRLICESMYEYQSQKYPFLTIFSASKQLHNMHQKYNTPCENLLETVQNQLDVMKHCGAQIRTHPSLIKHVLELKSINLDTASNAEIKAASAEAKNAYEAMVYLCSLNWDRYQDIMDKLANSFLQVRDNYPKTLVAAHRMATEWRGSKRRNDGGVNNDRVNFLQDGEDDINGSGAALTTKSAVLKRDGAPVKCNICNENHWQRDCPDLKEFMETKRKQKEKGSREKAEHKLTTVREDDV